MSIDKAGQILGIIVAIFAIFASYYSIKDNTTSEKVKKLTEEYIAYDIKNQYSDFFFKESYHCTTKLKNYTNNILTDIEIIFSTIKPITIFDVEENFDNNIELELNTYKDSTLNSTYNSIVKISKIKLDPFEKLRIFVASDSVNSILDLKLNIIGTTASNDIISLDNFKKEPIGDTIGTSAWHTIALILMVFLLILITVFRMLYSAYAGINNSIDSLNTPAKEKKG